MENRDEVMASRGEGLRRIGSNGESGEGCEVMAVGAKDGDA